jgi:mono/diheme cytochrome c family protein
MDTRCSKGFAVMKYSSVVRSLVLALISVSCAGGVQAANLGNVETGRTYVQTHCASCHSIAPGAESSPVGAATPFQAIADTGGMNRTALYVFFRTPHPNMPNLVVDGDDLDNVIAYILSLKSANSTFTAGDQ